MRLLPISPATTDSHGAAMKSGRQPLASAAMVIQSAHGPKTSVGKEGVGASGGIEDALVERRPGYNGHGRLPRRALRRAGLKEWSQDGEVLSRQPGGRFLRNPS